MVETEVYVSNETVSGLEAALEIPRMTQQFLDQSNKYDSDWRYNQVRPPRPRDL